MYYRFLKMHKACSECDLVYERESGFFLGAIYFNYGLTALLVTFLYIVLSISRVTSRQGTLYATVAVAVIFPLLFSRVARSLWLGFDFLIDPRPLEKKKEK